MKPRIVEHAAFHAVGMQGRFVPGKVEGIPALWDRFVRREGEIRDAVPGTSYGVCTDDSSPGAPGFHYTACVGVTSLAHVPEGMVGLHVPGATCAVFAHKGPISKFHQTMQSIFGEWIPASGLKPSGAPVFELYDHERYKGEDPESEFDVYVPVKKPSPA